MRKLLFLLISLNLFAIAFYFYPELTEPKTLALCFNHIGKKDINKYYWNVSQDFFRKILDHLSQGGYKTLTSEQLANFVDGRGTIPQKSVYLAFTGGYEEHADIAVPELQKRGFHGVFFLRVERSKEKGQLVGDEAKKLLPGGEIQTWGKTNEGFQDFTNNDTAYYVNHTEKTLTAMETDIKALTGEKPIALMHPDGCAHDCVFGLLELRGYRLGFMGISGSIDYYCHPYELRCNVLGNDDDMHRVIELLNFRRDETMAHAAGCLGFLIVCVVALIYVSKHNTNGKTAREESNAAPVTSDATADDETPLREPSPKGLHSSDKFHGALAKLEIPARLLAGIFAYLGLHFTALPPGHLSPPLVLLEAALPAILFWKIADALEDIGKRLDSEKGFQYKHSSKSLWLGRLSYLIVAINLLVGPWTYYFLYQHHQSQRIGIAVFCLLGWYWLTIIPVALLLWIASRLTAYAEQE